MIFAFLSEALSSVVVTANERIQAVADLLAAAGVPDEPMVFVPINHKGKTCGPPEVRYTPPAGPGLN